MIASKESVGEERREKREESKWPPARFTAYLQSPVTRGSKGGREESREKRAERAGAKVGERFGPQHRGRSTARIAAFEGWIVIASKESIAHMQSPWPCPLCVLRRDGRKQAAERREKREESTWPQARITAFLRCPVATSKKF